MVKDGLQSADKLVKSGELAKAKLLLNELLPKLEHSSDFSDFISIAILAQFYELALEGFRVYKTKTGKELRADFSQEDILEEMKYVGSNKIGGTPDNTPLYILEWSAIAKVMSGILPAIFLVLLIGQFLQPSSHSDSFILLLLVSILGLGMLCMYYLTLRITVYSDRIMRKVFLKRGIKYFYDLESYKMKNGYRTTVCILIFKDGSSLTIDQNLTNFHKLVGNLKSYSSLSNEKK